MNDSMYSVVFGLVGVMIGAFIASYFEYAKTRAMMKWETRYNAYNSILEFDKGFPINDLDKKKQIRFAKRLKALSENEEIKKIAETMIEGKFKDLKAKEKFIDENFIPAIEKDLKDTMNFFKWPFQK